MRVFAKTERRDRLNLSLKREMLEEVVSFMYFGSVMGKKGGVIEDVIGRVNEGVKVSGAMNKLLKVSSLGVNVKRIVMPSVLYGLETWALKEREKKRLDVMEMKCLRSMCGVT